MFQFLSQVWPFNFIFYKKIKPHKLVTVTPKFRLDVPKSEGHTYNPEFYATEETCDAIMRRFNAQVMFEKPIQDFERAAPPQWFIRFPDGLEINAGQLAKFFALYPETESSYAVNLGINLIAMLRMEKENDRAKAFSA